MKQRIVVAGSTGSTGDLGTRIVKALSRHDADVVALVHAGAKEEKLATFKTLGSDVKTLDLADRDPCGVPDLLCRWMSLCTVAISEFK